ncbi:MAG: hypothetical protein IPM64_07350 [Phycisphaerales bacterium]|nr:hypothetical protein [Phycisphaerales bacterium]
MMPSAFYIAVGAYAAIGLLFGAAFISVGLARFDAAARSAGAMVRLLLLPGAAALWPILAVLWLGRRGGAA